MEGLTLKLKLQYFRCLTRSADLLEKTLVLGKIEGRRRRDDRGQDGWMASLTPWTWVWASSRKWWRTGKPSMLQPMGLQSVRHDWVTAQQQYIHHLESCLGHTGHVPMVKAPLNHTQECSDFSPGMPLTVDWQSIQNQLNPRSKVTPFSHGQTLVFDREFSFSLDDFPPVILLNMCLN